MFNWMNHSFDGKLTIIELSKIYYELDRFSTTYPGRLEGQSATPHRNPGYLRAIVIRTEIQELKVQAKYLPKQTFFSSRRCYRLHNDTSSMKPFCPGGCKRSIYSPVDVERGRVGVEGFGGVVDGVGILRAAAITAAGLYLGTCSTTGVFTDKSTGSSCTGGPAACKIKRNNLSAKSFGTGFTLRTSFPTPATFNYIDPETYS